MTIELANAIFLVGIGQLCVLFASALVPLRLDWRANLANLPPLLRQMFWVYGGYIVLSIVSLGLICIFCAEELASDSRLARAFCGYGALFWGVRLALQPIFKAGPFLTSWWLRCGYHLLTVLFLLFVIVLGWGVVH